MTTQSSPEVATVPPLNVRPTCIRKSTKKDDFVYSCYSSSFSSFVAFVHNLHKMESYMEAVCDPLWHGAMAEELTALHQTHTWDLVPFPACKRAIDSRWVYKIKTKSDGSIERYKARLVTQGEVCKLWKALYGLKQALRAWYEKFFTIVTSLRFVASHHDSALFVKRSRTRRILLSLYVDDMIITGDDCDGIKLQKVELSCRFAIKDLGVLHGDPLQDPSLYRTIVGSLVYLTVTHPYIAYVVHIAYSHAYCDVEWAGDYVTHKYTTKFCVFLGDSLISLKSKKQDVLSRSSTQVEYRVMTMTIREIVWSHWLLADMGVHITSPTPLHCDNRSAIHIALNTVFHERTKYIEIYYYFTRH
ncbi:uncharacterized mitochondrial protein-like protein [Tanacetum coccineum]